MKRKTTCFIHNTQFSDDGEELKLQIYKNISSASYMTLTKENCIL